ncbi:hypothetical protein L3V82_00545 [Thiotrichales bacterium 19S3-7]|nr:hypothetical protein [Thiotrichales bacterium 19S3-7]MCF6800652.1 hypothetical protein [Thiotrichales bacterium 19S3-11]
MLVKIKYIFYLLVIHYFVVCAINFHLDLSFSHSIEWVAAIISSVSFYLINRKKAIIKR